MGQDMVVRRVICLLRGRSRPMVGRAAPTIAPKGTRPKGFWADGMDVSRVPMVTAIRAFGLQAR